MWKIIGKLGTERANNTDVVWQIRENHEQYFKNERCWEILKVAISLNVECSITKYNYQDINGDMEKCETKK